MPKTTYTATLPNGEVVTRKTERTYTHVVVSEVTYQDGEPRFSNCTWCGRPDLAQKQVALWERNWQKQVGVPFMSRTLQSFKVHAIPVNN